MLVAAVEGEPEAAAGAPAATDVDVEELLPLLHPATSSPTVARQALYRVTRLVPAAKFMAGLRLRSRLPVRAASSA